MQTLTTGHESAAVRTSCAGALAHAIEQYPGQIEATVTGLQDLYADKARLLQPEYDRFVSPRFANNGYDN